jgi:lipoyl(octanoyl) transferase
MEEWLLLRTGAGSAAFNMAVDEALLLRARESGKPVLRFYAWSEAAASFGYFQRYADVAKATPLRPLVRRPTGGGIVPHDRDWTYSVVLPPGHSWYQLKAIESYRRVHEWVRAAFNETGIPAELAAEPRREAAGQCFVGAEQFDVLAQNRKIAGAAQRRTRDGLLIQGSVQSPAGVKREAWEGRVCEIAVKNWQVSWWQWQLPPVVARAVEVLAANKYGTREHNERR